MTTRSPRSARLVAVGACVLSCSAGLGAPWIAADWAGKEPSFPPGSLFWKTNQYKRCPVLYRTVLTVQDRPIAFAGFRVRASWFAYVYLGADETSLPIAGAVRQLHTSRGVQLGRQVARCLQQGETATANAFDVELTNRLCPGRNVLIVSTTPEGFSMEGGVRYQDGDTQRFGSDPARWRVRKFPPLTMLEYQPCMNAEFDASQWPAVRESGGEPVTVSDEEQRGLCQRLRTQRLTRLDEDARWRLQMLREKGIAVVDWEASGWAGADRLPEVVKRLARPWRGGAPGVAHDLAEVLTSYVRLSDEATNTANHRVGARTLGASSDEAEAWQHEAERLGRGDGTGAQAAADRHRRSGWLARAAIQ